jgi:hypothetical protein
MYCMMIGVLRATEVAVYMWNTTTGMYAPFRKSAPAGSEVRGLSAEWILECPHQDGSPPVYVPRFGTVYFDSCIACAQDHSVILGGDGLLIPLKDANGFTVSAPRKVTDRMIATMYANPPP